MKKRANLELKFIVSLVFAIIVAVFAIQNAGSIEVKFFSANFLVSQAVVILASAIIGAIIVLLLGLVKQIKQNMKVKQLSNEIEALKLENNSLQAKLDEQVIVDPVDPLIVEPREMDLTQEYKLDENNKGL